MQNIADRWRGSAGGKGGGEGGGESYRSAVLNGVQPVTRGLSTRGNNNVDECGSVTRRAKVMCEVVTNWRLYDIGNNNSILIVCVNLQITLIEVVDGCCDEERHGRRDDVSDTSVNLLVYNACE